MASKRSRSLVSLVLTGSQNGVVESARRSECNSLLNSAPNIVDENNHYSPAPASSPCRSLTTTVKEYIENHGYSWLHDNTEQPFGNVCTQWLDKKCFLVEYSSSEEKEPTNNSCPRTEQETPSDRNVKRALEFTNFTPTHSDAPQESVSSKFDLESSPVFIDPENAVFPYGLPLDGFLQEATSTRESEDVGPGILNQTTTAYDTNDSKPVKTAKRKLNFGNFTERISTKARRLQDSRDPTQRSRRIVMVCSENKFLPDFFEEDVSSTDCENESNDSNSENVRKDSDSEKIAEDSNSKNVNDNSRRSTNVENCTLSSSNHEPTSSTSKTRNCKSRKNCRRRLHEESEAAKRSKAYNAGLAYVTAAGKSKGPRKIGPMCREKCNKCEKPKISEEDREKHFKEFFALSKAEKKWDYISRLVTRYEPKTCKTLPETAKRFIYVYKLRCNGNLVKVCKPTFLKTFGINASWVETAMKKVNEKGSITPDKRGKTTVRPTKTTDPQKASVRRHLDQIERVPSHYTRARTRKEYYFEAGLSLERLYKMYVEWVKDIGLPNEEIATKSMYREVFMTEYNIGFHEPLSDQCVIHSRWRNGNKEERVEMLEEYKIHLFNYNFIKKKKQEEKDYAAIHDDFCLACFDLEKVLTLPRSNISVMFYLTKLSMYNFTVMELNSKRGFCFLWNETVAHRGANEVASNILRFIEKMVAEGKTSFVFYSDSPTGQNKNRMVFAVWLYAAVRYEINIVHRFFECGHSFSEVDSMHGNIERESTKKEIFHPVQWEELILSCIQDKETYEIDHLTAENCLDFHQLVAKLFWKKDTLGEQVNWTLVREIRASHLNPDKLFFKYGYADEETCVVVNPPGKGFNIASYEFEQAVQEPIPLTQKKVADLTSLLRKKIIPSQFREYYQNLPGMKIVQ